MKIDLPIPVVDAAEAELTYHFKPTINGLEQFAACLETLRATDPKPRGLTIAAYGSTVWAEFKVGPVTVTLYAPSGQAEASTDPDERVRQLREHYSLKEAEASDSSF